MVTASLVDCKRHTRRIWSRRRYTEATQKGIIEEDSMRMRDKLMRWQARGNGSDNSIGCTIIEVSFVA